MPSLIKFGRSMRIMLQVGTGVVLPIAMWQDGRPVGPGLSLGASFVVRRSTSPQPHECNLTITGLSRVTRELITKVYEQAEEMAFKTRALLQAGKIRIDAGYGLDVATLFIGDIAPDGVHHEYLGPGHATHLRALDGRVPWKGRFVNRMTNTNVDLNTITQVLAMEGDYMSGLDAGATLAQRFPHLIKKKLGFPGYESGYAIFGESRSQNAQICADLGITPFFQDGELRYAAADLATLDFAVILSALSPGALLDWSPLGLGRYRVRTLMEHRMRPGRQVVLTDDFAKPIGKGLFRVEAMVAEGGNRTPGYGVEADLIPTALPGT